MTTKQSLIAQLQDIFDRWEQRLHGESEAAAAAPGVYGDWSIQDVLAHLHGWQQISIARVEAALNDTQPAYPDWLGGASPFYVEEHTADFNARIVALYREQPWPAVYQAWRQGFLRFLEWSRALPEADLLDPRRYPWLEGYPLSAVLEGTWEHHQEHLEGLPGSGISPLT